MRGLDAKKKRAWQVVERTSEGGRKRMGGRRGVRWKGRVRMLTEGRTERRRRVKESEGVY